MMKELKAGFEESIERELENTRSLEKAVENVRNSLVKELLEGIALDSKKHASFY